VYINSPQRGVGAAAEAERVLALLNDRAASDWQSLGDPLPVPPEFVAAGAAEVSHHFGRDFPQKLADLPIGRWSGPVESRYGLHLILVRERSAGRTPPLNEVREAVVREWRAAQRQELSASLRRQRRAKYAVTVEWPDWAREAVSLAAGAEAPKGAP
jgi:hypothetical protein